MAGFVDTGFVAYDTLAFRKFPPNILLFGEIACQGRLVLRVLKTLECLGDLSDANPVVQTQLYSYNLSVRGAGNIFHYDNQHLHENHEDSHHCHRFNWKTSDEVGSHVQWVGAKGWPTLGDVLQEARAWHSLHYSELNEPDSFVPFEDLDSELRF